MDIDFASNKLQKICNDHSVAVRKLGINCATKLRNRMDDLRAAPSLEVLRPPFPGRCHELKGDKEGVLSLDLEHPFRLLFEPLKNPPPTRSDGGLDWSQIDVVIITSIEDTHG